MSKQATTSEELRKSFIDQLQAPAIDIKNLFDSGSVPFLLTADTPYSIVPLVAPPLQLLEPDLVDVSLEGDGEPVSLGTFRCAIQQPAPLETAEREALLRRPGAMRAAVMELGCLKCSGKLYVWDSLDGKRPNDLLSPSVRATDAPDAWVCDCGKSDIPLKFLRTGFHELFRQPPFLFDEKRPVEFTPIYQFGAVDGVIQRYQAIISSRPAEERVQAFLEKNEVLWAFLGATRVIPKPKVLTRFVGDFAVLTSNKTLYIVELEKPQTRLTRGSGGLHSELQRGLDQINQWRIVVRDDWRGFLNAIKLREEEVHKVAYALIAGLSYQTPQKELRVIRSSFGQDVHFFTFDDLAGCLRQIQRGMSEV